ncbi:fumarylacetoacetate hydrolase family protein [Streptomyces caniscabiei]|uniref:Fumarylacetoacetate hydrolase family protein n=1 Tax=Streptomyces caniscabiei TaxID=2746961 RepID=A0A927L5F6_9ACTN|nr:fumarylacetoacetate hydrolase family protein [Streptomyces caniscabiei]MBD9725388.1 fumarylacetoacetate hydrolase family protein [Streptomyces caniscabiei]MDX3510941.1 fumarylacetoacetate hydrolase family protein [Streptomyces caniscabiei]MDX3720115.1 fumarylacetoacetate hydrolase family protein [Streptomyces caniscabiei]MDX3729299.1 fumarylacetoacetate hydrolase family protein [Streptomyces caniscabiei]WEO29227.1 fumarylacetoacetate hydrolase family protein [Streptomyces caniscabiei]
MKLANLAGRPVVVRDGRALDIADASKGAIEPRPEVLSDLSLHDELRALAERADDPAWQPFDPRDLGRVAKPYKAIGVALNYRAHAEESGLPVPDEPSVFAKFASSVIGPYDAVVVEPRYDKVDFEAELVVVMGRTGKNIAEAEAWSHVAGVTAGQDISDRKEQWRKPINQFTLPKSYDTFSPVGPYLVTVDEFADPDDIEVAGWVDDLEVQRGRTSDLIFSVPELIAWLSRRVTFEPGDMIFTGTPAGCGVRRTPRLYLSAGKVLRTEVTGVGTMVNPIVAG